MRKSIILRFLPAFCKELGQLAGNTEHHHCGHQYDHRNGDQVGLDHVFQGAALLAERRGQRFHADRAAVEILDDQVEQPPIQVVEAFREKGFDVQVQLLGERPCSANVDANALEVLKQKAADSVLRITGQEAKFLSASTDCNIPLSLGIPSVCMGVCEASGLHTREEVLYLKSLPTGCMLCMDFLCNFF